MAFGTTAGRMPQGLEKNFCKILKRLRHTRSEGPLPCVPFARYLLVSNFLPAGVQVGTTRAVGQWWGVHESWVSWESCIFIPFVCSCSLPFVSKFPKYKRRKSLSKSVKGEAGSFAFPHLTHLSLFPTWISWSCQTPSLALRICESLTFRFLSEFKSWGRQAHRSGPHSRAVQRRLR